MGPSRYARGHDHGASFFVFGGFWHCVDEHRWRIIYRRGRRREVLLPPAGNELLAEGPRREQGRPPRRRLEASGKEKLVVGPRCGKRPVGAKRTLVFFRRGGARTDWAMHEYRLLPADDHPPEANDVWVVCRVFKKTTTLAHRRSPPSIRGAPRRRAAAADDDDMPSSPSSCVTDGGDAGEEGEESSSCSVVASNCP
ncbi:hypothetical protein OsJ_04608 [Oryza sativa Japonica Group]|uniref:NAC domain-containing protein n=1 Tax=Oryza sativa subsp. japonica TaxID=39947 RepID=B9EVZ2_ORYSJ|nr:hypothetical protein OsJ_04608 [Oryza sativa Japonica Group]